MGNNDLLSLSFEWLTSLLILILLLVASGGVYYMLKGRLMTKDLGMGDLLFFLIIIPFFSTHGYILFLSISFVGAIVLHLSTQLTQPQKTIPLAGYQSIFLIAYLIQQYLFPAHHFSDF
jgi:hypothetical protein